MSDTQQPSSEPSIEEILDSIRKIISEDAEGASAPPTLAAGDAPVDAPSAPPEATPAAPSAAAMPDFAAQIAAVTETSAKAGPPAPEEDILELTDLVEEPPAPPAPAEKPAAKPAPVEAKPAPAAPVTAPAAPAPTSHETQVPLEVSMPDATSQSLVSETATTAAIDSLSKLAIMAEPKPHGGEVPGGHVTVDQMVRDMLKPLLKEWLDANLPQLVERIVSREIEKISRKAGV